MKASNGPAKGYTHLQTSSSGASDENEGISHDEALHDDSELLLRRVPDSLPSSAWLVLIVELCERFAFFGLSGPLQNYIQNAPHDELRPGGLGLGQANATRINLCFMLWSYLTPVIGAVVADQHLGRLRTIIGAAGFYAVGLVVLVVTSLPVARESGGAVLGLVLAMGLLGMGSGGIKPNVSALIAEQYVEPERKIRVLKTGEEVVLDRDMTVQRVFLLLYMAINVGSMSPLATTVIEQRLGFTSAFALPMVVFFLGLTVLLLSKHTYTSHPPEGSVVSKAARYLWLVVKNKGSFARAKNATFASQHTPPWDDVFADDLYLALQACKIFLFYPFFWVAYAQTLTNLVSQAGTMQTHGIPNDILINLDPLAVLLLAPLLEFALYPLLRRLGFPFRPIARIACGFIVIGLAMAYAAVLQAAIYAAPPCYRRPLSRDCLDGRVPNDVHVLAQAPVYILVALAEIFGVATGYEYAFKHAPASMRSFVMAVFLSTAAVGAALGIVTAPVFVDPTLVWAYSGLSVAAVLAGAAFWAMFKGTDDVKAGVEED